MLITATKLKEAADLAARIEYLESLKPKVKDQSMLIRADQDIAVTVPVSAQPARTEIDMRVKAARDQLTALGFELPPA